MNPPTSVWYATAGGSAANRPAGRTSGAFAWPSLLVAAVLAVAAVLLSGGG